MWTQKAMAPWEAYCRNVELGSRLCIYLQTEENQESLWRDGRSQDIPNFWLLREHCCRQKLEIPQCFPYTCAVLLLITEVTYNAKKYNFCCVTKQAFIVGPTLYHCIVPFLFRCLGSCPSPGITFMPPMNWILRNALGWLAARNEKHCSHSSPLSPLCAVLLRLETPCHKRKWLHQEVTRNFMLQIGLNWPNRLNFYLNFVCF